MGEACEDPRMSSSAGDGFDRVCPATPAATLVVVRRVAHHLQQQLRRAPGLPAIALAVLHSQHVRAVPPT